MVFCFLLIYPRPLLKVRIEHERNYFPTNWLLNKRGGHVMGSLALMVLHDLTHIFYSPSNFNKIMTSSESTNKFNLFYLINESSYKVFNTLLGVHVNSPTTQCKVRGCISLSSISFFDRDGSQIFISFGFSGLATPIIFAAQLEIPSRIYMLEFEYSAKFKELEV